MKTACLALLIVFEPVAGQTLRLSELGGMHQSKYLQNAPDDGRKSPLLATLLSIVLPGAGELYAGNTSTARLFMAADGVLWLTFAGFSLQSSWVMDDARSFARLHAGVDFAGKDDRFEAQVGNYMSLQEYNETKLRERRYDDVYEGTEYEWQWMAVGDRLRYRSMRIRSDELSQAAGFAVGALVVNRIISAFSAWQSAKSVNPSSDGWHIDAGLQENMPHAVGVGLRLTRTF
ncbi:MAG: hypothetical protein HBSIN02_09350 [Bacteroidia bacterium]|nr:MAG: hypothetical protein HBSIN02_09350 [Bacteroidia bacterium]